MLKKVNWLEVFESELIEVEPNTVGQYVSKDNLNDREIYEKDLYLVLDRDWFDYEKNAAICKVVFKDDGFKLKRINGGKCYRKDLNMNHGRDRFEYLGNIHDNPELLKGE